MNSVSLKSLCSLDNGKRVTSAGFFTTTASLQQLVLLVHSHSQQCTFPPSLRPAADPQSSIRTDSKGHTQAIKVDDSTQPVPKASIHIDPIVSIHTDPNMSIQTDPKASIQVVPNTSAQGDPKASIKGLTKASIHVIARQTDPDTSLQAHSKTPTQVQQCLKYACEEGHMFTWCPMQVELECEDTEEGEMEQMGDEEDVVVLGQKSIKEQARKDTKKDKTRCVDVDEQFARGVRTTRGTGAKSVTAENITESKDKEELESLIPNSAGEDEETGK